MSAWAGIIFAFDDDARDEEAIENDEVEEDFTEFEFIGSWVNGEASYFTLNDVSIRFELGTEVGLDIEFGAAFRELEDSVEFLAWWRRRFVRFYRCGLHVGWVVKKVLLWEMKVLVKCEFFGYTHCVVPLRGGAKKVSKGNQKNGVFYQRID